MSVGWVGGGWGVRGLPFTFGTINMLFTHGYLIWPLIASCLLLYPIVTVLPWLAFTMLSQPLTCPPPFPFPGHALTHNDVSNGGEEGRHTQVEDEPLHKELVLLEEPDKDHHKEAATTNHSREDTMQ